MDALGQQELPPESAQVRQQFDTRKLHAVPSIDETVSQYVADE